MPGFLGFRRRSDIGQPHSSRPEASLIVTRPNASAALRCVSLLFVAAASCFLALFATPAANAQASPSADMVQNISETIGSAHGLAWDGTNIWYDMYTSLFRYNVASASPTDTIIDPQGTAWKSMAFDGAYLWVTTANGYISQINPVTGVILNTVNESASYPLYATYDGSHYIWVNDGYSATLIRLQVK
jgi:hypothetical protein